MKILAINPGSTSTKISLYEDLNEEFTVNISHSAEQIGKYEKIADQYEFRKEEILKILANNSIELSSIDIFVGRGGLVKPIKSGVYSVNEALLRDLKTPVLGEHASNLGGVLAYELAKISGKPSYIADPVVVDEMCDLARVSGLPEIQRRSIFHALNQKAIARRYAREVGKKYEEMNLIIAHLGGGTSIGAHEKGQVIDVNDGLIGEGPFTPERAGALPGLQLLETFINDKKCNLAAMKKRMTGQGGLAAYFGTNDARELENRILAGKGEKEAFIFDAMAYQTAKCIGEMATVLKGKVDAIILTGGVAYSPIIPKLIQERVSFIAPVIKMPGENEMQALVENAYYASTGEYSVKVYQ